MQLRAATSDVHADLEKSLAVAQPQAGRTEYLAYLVALYGWLAPIEEALWQGAWPAAIDAASRAHKRHWITADLRLAGWADSALLSLKVSPYQPEFGSMPARFGVAYVIEGAQLGTQVLRKGLAPSLDGWSPRWLQGYGSDTGARWKVFIQCLETELATPEERQQAAQAARAAFAALASWFRQQGAA